MLVPSFQKLPARAVTVGLGVILIALAGLALAANRYTAIQETHPAAVGIWVLDRFTGTVEFCSPGGGCTEVARPE
jgi:hypothetical protein